MLTISHVFPRRQLWRKWQLHLIETRSKQEKNKIVKINYLTFVTVLLLLISRPPSLSVFVALPFFFTHCARHSIHHVYQGCNSHSSSKLVTVYKGKADAKKTFFFLFLFSLLRSFSSLTLTHFSLPFFPVSFFTSFFPPRSNRPRLNSSRFFHYSCFWLPTVRDETKSLISILRHFFQVLTSLPFMASTSVHGIGICGTL